MKLVQMYKNIASRFLACENEINKYPREDGNGKYLSPLAAK